MRLPWGDGDQVQEMVLAGAVSTGVFQGSEMV